MMIIRTSVSSLKKEKLSSSVKTLMARFKPNSEIIGNFPNCNIKIRLSESFLALNIGGGSRYEWNIHNDGVKVFFENFQ